ncbi:MAG TPA: ribonucleotide reductase subunit alpha [Porticoccus sp.]|nr:ribonucleotide reductase subunit alpha [Porticoccus sp.]
MQINITSYESLLSAANQQPEPQRLLFVFLRASLPDDHGDEDASRFHSGQGGALQPIMCVDKTLGELSTFSALVAEAERIEKDWQIVLVAGLAGKNGAVPSSDDAEEPLKMMLHVVENGGDLSKYMAFDREGVPVQFG